MCVGPRTTWGGTVWTLPSPFCSTQMCESDTEHEDQTADGALSLNHGIRHLSFLLRAFLHLANISPPQKNRFIFATKNVFNKQKHKSKQSRQPAACSSLSSQVIACRCLPKTEAPPPQHSPERTSAQGPHETPPGRHAETGERALRCTAPKG